MDVLADPLPPALAVDTSIFFAALTVREQHRTRARALLDRLAGERVVVVCCRPLLFLELWSACSRLVHSCDRRQLDRLVSQAEVALTGQGRLRMGTTIPGAIEGRRRFVVGAYERLLEFQLRALRTSEMRLTRSLLTAARDAMCEWGLRPHDACVLALALHVQKLTGTALHLATLDRDFEVVGPLHLWGLPSPN